MRRPQSTSGSAWSLASERRGLLLCKILRRLCFSCAPNARSGLDAGEPAIAASRSVGSRHIQSHVLQPAFEVFIPFGRLSPLTVH